VTGGWSTSIKGENFGPTQIKGYWSVIREGDDWKIRMLTSNVAPAPPATDAATPSPTTTPTKQQVCKSRGYGFKGEFRQWEHLLRLKDEYLVAD
jgi:hypothetical protein